MHVRSVRRGCDRIPMSKINEIRRISEFEIRRILIVEVADPRPDGIPTYSNRSITRSILARMRSLQRLPILPSWVWRTSRVGRYVPACTCSPTRR